MSWSFHIKGGDLSLSGPGGYAKVTGAQKLIQDLKHWLLEPRGSDPFHPEYGSVIEGGTLPDGTIAESMIGATATSDKLLELESELRRILTSYQEQQLNRLRRESAMYQGKNTFAPGEILYSVDAVDVTQYEDVALAKITITTQSGQQVAFAQPVG